MKNETFTDIKCPGYGSCLNQGICDVLTGTCACHSGFQGDTCEGKTFFSYL